MLKRTFLSGLLLLAAVLPLAAQESSDTPWIPSNRLGAGFGIIGVAGGASSGTLLSVMYSHTLLPCVDVEASLQSTTSSGFREIDLTHTLVSPNYYNLSFLNLTTFDATVVFSPFRAGILSGVRLGVGATVQNRQIGIATTYQGGIGTNPPDSALRIYPPSYYAYTNDVVFGGNLKLDYVIPLSQVLDVGARLQTHILLLRLSGNNNDAVRVFASGTASASIFFRVGF